MKLDKDFLPHSINRFSIPTISRPLLLEIKVLRGLKLLRTHYSVNISAMLVEREITMTTNAPIYAPALL
jgi:hypothetical protein